MSDTNPASTPLKPRRRWLRGLAWFAAVLLVLVLAAYLTVTSSAFFQGVILPRVGAALNAKVTVSAAAIHPFSAIDLRDLKVQVEGQPPLVTASEVRVGYHLFDILHGNLHVDEIALVSPTVEMVENPDGSSNLGPILKALQAKPTAEAKPAPKSGAAKPLQIDLGKLTLSQATLRHTKNYSDGRSDRAELANVNVTLTNLKNGQSAKLDLNADLRVENHSTNSNDQLAASLKANFSCAVSADLQPDSMGGDLNFTVSQAAGAFSDFAGFGAALTCDVTPTDIKQLALRFQRAGVPLGELAVAGPFDAEKMEGKLNVTVRGLDKRLLNLVGAKSGMDFGTTQIDSTNQIQLAKSGATIIASGRFNLAKLQLTRTGQTTPTVGLMADYDVTVDRTAQIATLRSLNLAGTQNGARLLAAQLTSPMNLAWGAGASETGDAAFDLAVTDLKLADWKPFIGNLASAGDVGLKLKVSSHQGGKQIGFDLNADVAKLSARLGSNEISQAEILFEAHGQAEKLKQIVLSAYKLQVAIQNQPALSVSGSANYDLDSGDADSQLKLHATLARLLQALPQPDLSISAGEVDLDGRVTQKQKTQTVIGDLKLENLTGKIGKNDLLGYGTQVELDVANSPDQIQINHVAGSFSQNGNAGGNFDLSGVYKPAPKTADLNVKFSAINENALRPILEPMLAGKKLVTVAVNGVVAAQYDPNAASAVKATIAVTNLLVSDPKQQMPGTPLAVGLQVDVSLKPQAADVRLFQISLTPTARANNELRFSGQLDFSKTNTLQGQLKLAADALDLTSYYDLFAGGTNAAAAASGVSPAPANAGADQEPQPITLPLENFTFAADIGKIYLREIVIAKFTTTAKINGGQVLLKPLQCSLNDAPVSVTVDLDLSAPGYKYNVAFDLQRIPMAPLINTFAPAQAGQMGGWLSTAAQITGAGITGASLQKNLAGQFNLAMTNLNLAVINVHNKTLKSLINVIGMIPELVKTPDNAIATLLGGVSGNSGLANSLQKSPIQFISMNATAGSGQIKLEQAKVQSDAFLANAKGTVTLNPTLTNSAINVPVTVSLSQPLAKQLNVAPATPDPKAVYTPLPDFLTMTGSLGNPKAKIDKLALAALTVRSVGGNILNPSATNASPVGNLLNQFLQPANNKKRK